MQQRFRIAVAFVGTAIAALLPAADAQQPDPNSPRYKGVVALSDFLTSEGEGALKVFVDEKVSKKLLSSEGRERVSTELDQLRSTFAGARRSGASPVGPYSASVSFSNGNSISFEMEPNLPYRFVRIGSIGGEEPAGQAVGCSTPSQQSGSATSPQQSGVSSFEELDEKLNAEASAGTFSGVVLVAKDGEPIFHKAYGYADKKAGRRNRKDTKFNLGSINKLFTMVAVYQLLDAGKLGLDDTIGKYLPQFPPSVADSVTVKHLLDHRSGWAAYWDNPTWNARRAELRSLDDYMDFIKDIPLDFEPGTRKQYSNTGYEVLGAIVQAASGQSYYDYVRDHIYKPAGMMNTDAYVRDGSTPNMAIGYAGGGYAKDNSSMLSLKGTAAGGGMSTTADMLGFATALGAGTLVPKKYSSRFRGIGVGGGGPGVNAELDLDVAGDHTIVVLSNFDPPTASRIGGEITGILRGNNDGETGANRYRIGVGLEPGVGELVVNYLEPGRPGEKGGLKPDDVILALNGKPITDDPIGQLDALLAKPDPIRLQIRRGDSLQHITITPEPTSAATPQPASPGAAPCEAESSSPPAASATNLSQGS